MSETAYREGPHLVAAEMVRGIVPVIYSSHTVPLSLEGVAEMVAGYLARFGIVVDRDHLWGTVEDAYRRCDITAHDRLTGTRAA